jgi:hypothetical protein
MIFFFILPWISLCNGYGGEMHKYLGVQLSNNINMDEHLSKSIAFNISNEAMKKYSVWADVIKRQPKYLWSRSLHYIDINECERARSNLTKVCENSCIYTGILNETNTIYMEGTNMESFKFLLHFLQDLFQPMHVYGPYRGGNDLQIILKTNGSMKRTNLHYLWDTIFPLHYLNNVNSTILTVKQIYTFKSMYDYNIMLRKIILQVSKVSCKVTKSHLKSSVIDFDKYFKDFKGDFGELLQEYINFAISTCKFIFERGAFN